MTQFVRQDTEAELAPGLFNGALHIGFVHPVTDQDAGARMAAGMVGRKEPGPGPCELVFGIFFGELVGQGQRDAVEPVAVPKGPCRINLLSHFQEQSRGQGHDPVMATLGTADAKSGTPQIDIFDAQIERLRDAQATTVKQARQQVGGIPIEVGDGAQQGVGFWGGGRGAR